MACNGFGGVQLTGCSAGPGGEAACRVAARGESFRGFALEVSLSAMFEVGCNENATGKVKYGGSSAKAENPAQVLFAIEALGEPKAWTPWAGGIECNFFAQAATKLLELT